MEQPKELTQPEQLRYFRTFIDVAPAFPQQPRPQSCPPACRSSEPAEELPIDALVPSQLQRLEDVLNERRVQAIEIGPPSLGSEKLPAVTLDSSPVPWTTLHGIQRAEAPVYASCEASNTEVFTQQVLFVCYVPSGTVAAPQPRVSYHPRGRRPNKRTRERIRDHDALLSASVCMRVRDMFKEWMAATGGDAHTLAPHESGLPQLLQKCLEQCEGLSSSMASKHNLVVDSHSTAEMLKRLRQGCTACGICAMGRPPVV
mmetsp:Transcript_14096/g.26344  ORF Transcript_14096/g.26344 Transcript_14096/m.26344 type:complete len:258 (+) Transcript_14096:83-856(+)